MSRDPSEELDALRALIDEAERIAVFTGAGISTESGIPDYRSPGTGLWNKIKPVEFQDFVASPELRKESWRRRFSPEDRSWQDAKPNSGHLAVAKLIRGGKAIAVITQNVDNLHQESGVADEQVIELHGNTGYAKCLACQMRYELADLERQFRQLGEVSPCGRCGGIVKTATISFGQAMPEDAMAQAEQATRACDLFLVLGSSLLVYPAAGFPQVAKRYGAKLVIVNREPTPLDDIADLVLHRQIGPTLSYVVGVN